MQRFESKKLKEKSSFRTFERFKPGAKCKAKLIHADEVAIKNISIGGILVETTRRLNVNTNYRIQIISSDNNEVITPTGTVARAFLRGTAHTETESNTVPLYEVALKFIGLKDSEKDFIKKLFSLETKTEQF